MKFSFPGADTWSEGKLVLEDGHLYCCCNGPPKRFSIPLLESLRGLKSDYTILVSSIRDVIRKNRSILILRHTGNATLPVKEPESESDLLLATHLSADEHVLNEVERELLYQINASEFTVYFMHAGKGGVLSMDKNVEIEKGLLKFTNEALWIIGRNTLKRVSWDDLVNAEQKKRGSYKGTEYGALAIDYFDKESTNNEIISTVIITRGTTMDVLKRHV